MPTRANFYFNNPQMAAIASNLSSLFAPPSAQDFLMQAKTEGQDFQNQAIRQAWEAMAAEGVTPDIQDRFGIAATLFGQGFNPSQSNRALDMASADRRYGVDVGARNALDVQGMRNAQSSREAAFGAAVNPQGRQAVSDADIAALLGVEVPGFGAAGPVAPTDAQVQGAQTQRLINSGNITDEMLIAQAFGNTPVEQVVTPDGVRNVTRPQALGQEPFVNRGAEAARRPVTLISPEGQQIPGFFDPSTGGYFLADGSPAPSGFRAAGLAQPTGSNADLGLTTTGQNRADMQFINATRSLETLNELDELLARNPGATGLAGDAQRLMQNLVQTVSEVGQLFGENIKPEDLVNQGFVDQETYNTYFNSRFNPNLSEIDILFNQLVWAYAAGQQNDGRVSNQQMEQARLSLGINGSLSNTAQVRAALSRLRGQFERDRASAAVLANENVQRAYSPEVRGGRPAAAPDGASRRLRYNPETGDFEEVR